MSQLWKEFTDKIVTKALPLSLLDLIEIIDKLLDETNSKLEKIDSNITKLMRSHFIRGKHLLRDASSSEAIDDPGFRDSLINEARQAFVEAASIKENHLTEAQASELVGVCFELLDKKILALEWYERAYSTAWEGLNTVDTQYNKTANNFLRDFRKGFEFTFYISIIGIPIGLVLDLTDPGNYMLWSIEKRRNSYREYLVELSRLLIAKSSKNPDLKPPSYFEDNSNFAHDESAAPSGETIMMPLP